MKFLVYLFFSWKESESFNFSLGFISITYLNCSCSCLPVFHTPLLRTKATAERSQLWQSLVRQRARERFLHNSCPFYSCCLGFSLAFMVPGKHTSEWMTPHFSWGDPSRPSSVSHPLLLLVIRHLQVLRSFWACQGARLTSKYELNLMSEKVSLSREKVWLYPRTHHDAWLTVEFSKLCYVHFLSNC